jgi:hypothetical protein
MTLNAERPSMSAIKGTFKNGQVVLDAPPDWPEGCRLKVEPEPLPEGTVMATDRPRDEHNPAKIGLDESEWRDDPEALADWKAWLQTIEPVEFTPEEAAIARFNEEMRRFNIEAVRRQMQESPPE